MQPEIKEVPATQYLVRNYPQITVLQIPEIAGNDLGPLMEAVQAADLEIAGDPTFFYRGCDGSEDTPFDFAIGIPVLRSSASDVTASPPPYELRTVTSNTCMAMDYIGGMPNIVSGWHAVYAAIQQHGRQPSGESREIYKHWVDFESPMNVTEIQVEIS